MPPIKNEVKRERLRLLPRSISQDGKKNALEKEQNDMALRGKGNGISLQPKKVERANFAERPTSTEVIKMANVLKLSGCQTTEG